MIRLLIPKAAACWVCAAVLQWLPVSANAANALELAQIHANRAVGSLAMYRGEGMQKPDAARLENDLAALHSAFSQHSEKTPELEAAFTELVKQVRLGQTFGPHEEDMPWRYPEDLSKALRDFLLHAHKQANSSAQGVLPIQIEYLAMQYLYRSYIGSFETARDEPDIYLGQDERLLVPSIDAVFAERANDAAINKLKVRWSYLRSALNDMNSQSNALESVSGRPFAPITVGRHSRSLTDNWVSLESE